MPTPSDSRYRLVEDRQSWRVWDGAVVVFEPLSGDTHRIEPPGGHILSLLAASQNTKAAIESELKSKVTLEKIEEALDLLLAMELVEPA